MWDERDFWIVQKVDLSLPTKSPHVGPCPGAPRRGASWDPEGQGLARADEG